MKLFVWDFHGVLEKDNDKAVWEISNLALSRHGFTHQFTFEDCLLLSGRKWFEYFQYLLPNEPLDVHLNLQGTCLLIGEEQPEIVAKYILPTDHAHSVLDLIGQKHEQILISNSQPGPLKRFVERVNMVKFFGSQNTFAANNYNPDQVTTKIEILDRFLNGKHYEQVVVIGDSPRDIDLANRPNAISYLYSHPGIKFRSCRPTHKIRDLRKLLREI